MGIFSKLFGGKGKQPEPEVKATPIAQPEPEPVKVQPIPFLPTSMEGQPIRYAYVMDIVPAPGVDVVRDVLANREKLVDVRSDNGCIALLYQGNVFGYIENEAKAQMVADWERKQLPCSAVLLAPGNRVNLRFYHDRRIGAENREQTIHRLTACKSERKQEALWSVKVGDEVTLEEDVDHEGVVLVSSAAGGDEIGRLPKKAAERFIEQEAYAAYIETLDEDDEGRTIPSIRIYW